MALRTRLCGMLGIEHPILLAGMGRASTPELAAAVSDAGGLGVLGAATCGPNRLRQWIRRTRALTGKPFGVDTLLPASVRRGGGSNAGGPSAEEMLGQHRRFARDFLQAEGLPELDAAALDDALGRDGADRDGPPPLTREFFEAQMEVVVEERVPVYAAGLGNPGPWVERLRRNGTVVLAVVGTTRHARQVVDAGVDAVVAQGHDGGGHNAPVGTMALVPQVVDAVGDRVPVVGAGGIGDGRGVAAALMLGAEGAWIGTAFLATTEAGIPEAQKRALVAAGDEGTTVSRSVTGKPARMLKNRWAQAYAEAGLEPLPMPRQGAVSAPVTAAAMAAGRADVWGGFAGQGLGMVRAVRPAAEVLRGIVEGAERALAERAAGLLGRG
ncbi:nitronate monooxygenase family protein [Craurococcus roseus]|uniref:Nitronate monooxygenase family protein n=1 Tax=Craurococcus roseus TaxID=77585 RepID=A0ABN1ENZ7_9PROT